MFSGRTGALLVVGRSPDPNEFLGESADGCGDMDGDGRLDFAAGAEGSTSRGMVTAFSGATGNAIRSWYGSCPVSTRSSLFGRTLSGSFDLDRDGVRDLVVGAPAECLPSGNWGAVWGLSGRDGTTLWGIESTEKYYMTLLNVIAVGRAQPGSWASIVVLGEPWFSAVANSALNYKGRIRVYHAAPPQTKLHGTACAGTLRTLPVIGIQDRGNSTRIHLSGASTGQPALLCLGLSRTQWGGARLPLSLGSLGFQGCLLQTSVEAFALVPTGTAGNSAGYTFAELPLPLARLGPGWATLYGQWLALDVGVSSPGGASDMMEWRH